MAEKYWFGGSTNNAGDWAWDSAKADTIDNAAATDEGGGLVGIPVTGTIFAAGESVVIAGTTNYNGTYTLDAATTANKLVITETYAGETFAGTETVTTDESNWKLVSDGSDTAKPAAGDSVCFNSRAANDSGGNKQAADVNTDAAGTGTPDLAGLYVSSDFDGDIGTAGEYLEIEVDGDDIVIDGTGTYYLKLSAGTGNDAGCGKVVLSNTQTTVHLASLENDASNVGLWALVLVFDGRLYIDDDTAITSLTVSGRSAKVSGGSGITNAKTTTDASVTINNGSCSWNSDVAALDIYSGSFNWGHEDMTAIASAVVDVMSLFAGGTFTWQMAATNQSTINQFILYGGTLNAGVLINSGYSKVIGDGSKISELWPAAKADLNNYNRNISIAAGSDIECFGGTLIPPAGAVIDW